MLAEFKYKTGIALGAGLLLIIAGRLILRSGGPAIVGATAVIGGLVLFIWGCSLYAKSKGLSGWWGLLGLFTVFGLLILFTFPDRHTRYEESETRAMPSKGFLRTLIVTEICLGVLSIVVSLLTESSLPESLRTYVEAEAEADITARHIAMLATAIPLIILLLVSSIGLFFFWGPARILYLITIVGGLLLTPFFGPYVDAGWGAAFEDAAIIVSGVILALIYFSPLRTMYEKPTIAA
jgi:hypothetical protein